MEKQQISDPYNVLYEAVDNDNILLITRVYGDFLQENCPWITGMVQEYYGIDSSLVKVDDLGITEGEHWASYKIVSNTEGQK